MILDMRRCQVNLPNRCRRQIDRIARRAFDGEQWMNREGCAATTGNTYCGNLLWQSSLTLSAPKGGAWKRFSDRNCKRGRATLDINLNIIGD